MFTTSIDLDQFADIAAAMTITRTEDRGLLLVHEGTHDKLGLCTLAQCEGLGLLVSTKRHAPTA